MTAIPVATCAAPAKSIPLNDLEIAGFAVDAGNLYVWGRDAYQIDLRTAVRRKLAIGQFAEGGCVLDHGLVLNSISPRELIWIRFADQKRFLIDTSVDTRDAIPADLLGHHGVLLIHKRQQVRFYDVPSPMRDRWQESELYSIYTPSTEGGLAIADIDGDGLPDLLCGNYWMKSPTAFELPWREFAIDLWSEQEGSAMLRLAHSSLNGKPVRVAGQRDMRPARAFWFVPPQDPAQFLKQIWQAHSLGEFQGVSGALFLKGDLILSERDAPGRVVRFRRTSDGFAPPQQLARTGGVLGITALPDGRLLVLEKSQATLITVPDFN